MLNNDNDESRDWIEHCYKRNKTVVNPIIEWSDDEVWEFIKEYNIPYCELYDKGSKRLGCIGCPMGSKRKEELEKYPRFKELYMRAFERMLEENAKKGKQTKWKTPQDVYDWWVNG